MKIKNKYLIGVGFILLGLSWILFEIIEVGIETRRNITVSLVICILTLSSIEQLNLLGNSENEKNNKG